MNKKTISLILLLLVMVLKAQSLNAQQRRPIDASHPLWLIHVDVWYQADPQKIIDLIPSDIRPYVCLNLSLSCQYDTQKNVYKMPHYAFQTYKSWATVCQQNRLWFTCQPASGGHTHIQDDDMQTFEYFFRQFPNFLGWNYAEQFWGFDESGDKSSSTQMGRWALFARLVELSHKYGGLLTVSFCGNVWSHALNPLGELKRCPALLEACKQYPESILWLYKYTTSSCFYNNESVTFGPFISGLTTNYGVRYDNCGWNGALDALLGEGHGKKYPGAAGIGTVMEQTCVNGGAVWDGPELTWREECFHEVEQSTVDGYQRRNWQRFPNMDGVWIDMFRKVIDGTMYIPTREEVVQKTKVVVVNDVASGSDELCYAAWGDLYDGLYKQSDPFNANSGQWMDNHCYLKSTGRYGTIPVVTGLYDAVAQQIPLQVKKSAYTSRWSTTAKKQADFNAQYPVVSTGDLYVNRYRNQLVTYTPYTYLNSKTTATATVPLQYNTCQELRLQYGKLSSGLIREYEDHIDFYLNNYRADTTTQQKDIIVVTGVSQQPSYTLTKHVSAHSATATAQYNADAQTYTVTVSHCGGADLTVYCQGTASRSAADAIALQPLEAPALPPVYHGEVLIEAEDMDFKSVANCCTDPYSQYPSMTGHSGNGFVDMGTNKAGALRHQLLLDDSQTGNYVVGLRYTCPTKSGRVAVNVNGRLQYAQCDQTAQGEWRWATVKVAISKNQNNMTITNSNSLPLYIDQVSYRPEDVAPMQYGISIRESANGTVATDRSEAAEGDTVTLTVSPQPGSVLTELRVVNSVFFTQERTISFDEGSRKVKFVMPGDNVTLQPAFVDRSVSMKLDFGSVDGGAMPAGWRTVEGDDVHEYPGTYSMGPRTMTGFTGYQGKALYWRNGQADYGRQAGYPLTLEPGEYKLTWAMAAWKSSPTYKVNLLSSSGAVVASSAQLTAQPNASGSTAANLTAAKQHELTFTIAELGNYVIQFARTSGGYDEYLLLECRVDKVVPQLAPGDANADGAVDFSDVTAIVAHILGRTPSAFDVEAADANGDGVVNIADVTTVIAVLAKGQ